MKDKRGHGDVEHMYLAHFIKRFNIYVIIIIIINFIYNALYIWIKSQSATEQNNNKKQHFVKLQRAQLKKDNVLIKKSHRPNKS